MDTAHHTIDTALGSSPKISAVSPVYCLLTGSAPCQQELVEAFLANPRILDRVSTRDQVQALLHEMHGRREREADKMVV